MPIFARRTLQRLLDETGPLTSAEKQSDQIRRLNAGGRDALATAWELAVTSAFRAFGRVEVEPDLGTSSRVDFRLQISDRQWDAIGDVATVFDDGMYQESGQKALESAVWSRIDWARLRRADFIVWIDADVVGADRKRRIKLPTLDLERLYRDLDPFLHSVKVNRGREQTISCRMASHGFHIRYDGRGGGGYVGGVKVDAVYGLDANPLMNALKRKASQLKDTKFNGARFIVCCDGGADALRSQVNHAWNTPSTQDILRDFLRRNTSICGVLLVLVRPAPLRPYLDARMAPPYWVAEEPSRNAGPADRLAMRAIAQGLPALLPGVVRAPTSFERAWEAAPRSNYFRNFGQRIEIMPKKQVRVPLRALQELLAGTRSIEDFRRATESSENELSLIARWTQSGRLIRRAAVVPEPELDDDWIEFEFGEGDPATNPLKTSGSAGP